MNNHLLYPFDILVLLTTILFGLAIMTVRDLHKANHELIFKDFQIEALKQQLKDKETKPGYEFGFGGSPAHISPYDWKDAL